MKTYEQRLRSIALDDERIVVMTAENRAAIRTLPADLGPRFIDVGITEQTMIGAAAGLALRGRIPVVHALASFLTMRAFEFIRTDVGLPNLPVKMVGYVPGFLSEANGPTHQALEDVALMRGIPNVNVFCPADQEELADALPSILADQSPWYIRYTAVEPVVAHYGRFVSGTAEVLSDGMDVALLTYGLMNREAWRAKEFLEESGLSVRFVNFRTLKPIDHVEIIRAAKECSLLVTVEDHFETGGLASIVSESMARSGDYAPLLTIALQHRWFVPSLLPEIFRHEGFTGEHIVARILQTVNHDEDAATMSTDFSGATYISPSEQGE